jgi:peroxiredoxin
MSGEVGPVDQILIASSVLLWILILANLLLTLALVRRVNANSSRRTGLRKGQQAPPFAAETLHGERVTLTSYLGRELVLVFISAGCGPCHELLQSFEALRRKATNAGVLLALVSLSDRDETMALVDQFSIAEPILIAPGSNPFKHDYKVTQTPAFYLIDTKGTIQVSGHAAQTREWRAVVASWEQGTIRGATLASSEGG